jgi:hypothetical protein
MVSRRFTGPLRTILPVVAAGLVAVGIAGCSAGQVTQTDEAEPAVNGNLGNVGDIALRNVLIAYPTSDRYREGDDAPLTLTIVNRGGTNDELVGVSSPAATDVELIGKAALPARTGLQVMVPEEPAEPTETTETTESAPSSEPSGPPETSSEPKSTPSPTETGAPEDIGTMNIVLTGLTKDLSFGKNVPVAFVFAHAGRITIQVPIDNPEHAREASDAE